MDMNMDLKDILAKFKAKQGKNDARKGNPIVAFFEKNPKMKIIIPVILLVIAAIVAVVFVVNGVKTETDVNTGDIPKGVPVDVLPMVERKEGVTLEDGVDPFSEDIIAHAKYKGILNADGLCTAVLQTATSSYVVQVGDHVGESDWLVDSIDEEKIVVSIGEKTRTLKIEAE